MEKQKTMIIDEASVVQKLKRIAYQILEENYTEKEIVLIGIRKNGYLLAEHIQENLQSIRNIDVPLYEIALNKRQPNTNKIDINFDPEKIKGKCVIIIDDVANTGKTIFYALSTLMTYPAKKIQIAVLVDREHKAYPIRSNYVGLSLSTTLKEHVEVNIDNKDTAVYLS